MQNTIDFIENIETEPPHRILRIAPLFVARSRNASECKKLHVKHTLLSNHVP